MQVGDSYVPITIDSLAGTKGYIASLAGATCTLVVTATTKPTTGAIASRVLVPTERFTLNGDGRTLVWTKMASDTPYGAVYQLQIVAVLANGETRTSDVGQIAVLPDI